MAVHVTGVVPIGNAKPLAGTQAGTTAPSTRSIAVAVKVTIALVPFTLCAVIPAGSDSTGPV